MGAQKKSIIGGALLISIVSFLVYAQNEWIVEEKEHKVPYSTLPAVVRTAAEKILGGSGKYKAETEVDKGFRFYEVEANIGGNEISLKLSESGKLVEIERSIPFADLPEAARRELKREYPRAVFSKIEDVEIHFYEVKLRVDGKTHKIRVFASGDIEDEKDDGDDHGDDHSGDYEEDDDDHGDDDDDDHGDDDEDDHGDD